MKGVSRPCVSRSRRTSPSGNASTSRSGGVVVPTGTLTTTVAAGAKNVPGTRPVTLYEPGALTALLSVGAGQMTGTSVRSASGVPSLKLARTVEGRRGSMPTVVSTVMDGTSAITAAKGDVIGMSGTGST